MAPGIDIIGQAHTQLTADRLAVIVAGLALLVSIFSYRAARKANKAALEANRVAIFDRRFSVYTDAEKFLGAWFRHGKPDWDEMPTLLSAINRSQLLFPKTISKYLEMLKKDAIEASRAASVVSGETEGRREQAVEKQYVLMKKYAEKADGLGKAFQPYIKVE